MHFGGLVQRRVCEHLMDVGTVCLANVVSETMPALLVKLGEVRLVLRIDHLDELAAEHDDVGHEMTERAVGWIGPIDRDQRFSPSSNAHDAAGKRRFTTDQPFN